ncbi:amidohydrolase family protein [Luteimonas sp. R10]|uniref:amidohydrolase family protein n=1 Tax=Luteimonas sp. R10 TaxID=3108176 RepID=UPI003091D619|nr:amidohydrolase family protein [Luteimonas sp. R10]
MLARPLAALFVLGMMSSCASSRSWATGSPSSPSMPGTQPARVVAIMGGTVVIGDGSKPIENGTVVLRDGRILAAGERVQVPADAQRIDATGKWVTPGIFAGFTRVGLVELDLVESTNDTAAESSAYSAAIDIAPAVDWRASAIGVSRRSGVTRALVAPRSGKSLFAGQGAVIDLADDPQVITRPRAFQFVELGELGASRAGGSRAAAHLELRLALQAAQSAGSEQHAGNSHATGGSRLQRADIAALVPVASGEMPLLAHVERASDILAALELKREFPGLALVLVGAGEGWMVADRIAAAGVPVIASALNNLPSRFEMQAATQSNIGMLHAAGVVVAVGMIDDFDSRQARVTRQYAGNLVALSRLPGAVGLQWDQAFAAITSRVAEIMGLGAEIGSLRPGRRADVVIWDTDPLELASMPERVLIDGQEQPLRTRQTELRDRYLSPAPSGLPKAYEP